MTVSHNWWPWYRDVLDGLGVALLNANVEWATDGEGNPWLIEGQKRPAGIGHPYAMVLQFQKRRDEANSSRRNELIRLETTVAVFGKSDPQTPEENLRQTVERMAAVETKLYDDRSLGGNCDYLTIDTADAFELETNIGRETVGEIQATITKQAAQPDY